MCCWQIIHCLQYFGAGEVNPGAYQSLSTIGHIPPLLACDMPCDMCASRGYRDVGATKQPSLWTHKLFTYYICGNATALCSFTWEVSFKRVKIIRRSKVLARYGKTLAAALDSNFYPVVLGTWRFRDTKVSIAESAQKHFTSPLTLICWQTDISYLDSYSQHRSHPWVSVIYLGKRWH